MKITTAIISSPDGDIWAIESVPYRDGAESMAEKNAWVTIWLSMFGRGSWEKPSMPYGLPSSLITVGFKCIVKTTEISQ